MVSRGIDSIAACNACYCLPRRFARDNCPSYLEEANFRSLKDDELIGRLNVVSGTFMDALKQRKYSKVRPVLGL